MKKGTPIISADPIGTPVSQTAEGPRSPRAPGPAAKAHEPPAAPACSPLQAGEVIADDEAADDAPEPSAESETRVFTIDATLHGQRLDRALAARVPEFSRSYLQQLLEAGAVRLAGRAATRSSQRVKAGEPCEIELRPTPQSQAFVPEPMELQVVYEDEFLLVLNKPAGLVVHPAPGNWRGTLLNGLLARDPKASLLPRAGIVHRLDKDTSGLMVVARERQTMDALVRMIAARTVSRQYLALAHRHWRGAQAREVDAPIGRDPAQRLRMAVVDLERHPGKPASTLFEFLGNSEALVTDTGPARQGEAAARGQGEAAARGQGGGACLVRASLRTGRTHQIRVHLAYLGHPIVADGLYGGSPAAGLHRQALHAWQLAFQHPVTGQPLCLRAAPPADFQEAMATWGLRYNEMASSSSGQAA